MKILNKEDVLLMRQYAGDNTRISKFIEKYQNETSSDILKLKKTQTRIRILINLLLILSFAFNIYFYFFNVSLGLPIVDMFAQNPSYTGSTAILAIAVLIFFNLFARKEVEILNLMLTLLNEDQKAEDLRLFLKRTS